jgi:hypothetical protein
MDASAVTGNVRAVTHKIRLEKDEPFRIRPYHLNEQKKCALYECINEMLAAGVIERSESEYCSPVVLVKKKDGTVRFCTDYRRLNALTKDEAAALPRIQEVLRDFGTAQVFSSIDLKSGYWQIPMDPASKHLTAFATPDGATYQHRVMPSGRHHCILRDLRRTYRASSANLRKASGVRITLRPRKMPFRG